MKDFGMWIGMALIAVIIFAVGLSVHLSELDKIAIAKAKTACVCKENE